MSFQVYILYSASIDQYYIGHSEHLGDRLFRHTNSGSKVTKKASDWKVIYTASFETKSEAYKREMEIKGKKSRKYIEWLICQRKTRRPVAMPGKSPRPTGRQGFDSGNLHRRGSQETGGFFYARLLSKFLQIY